MSRYVERAENVARFIDVNLNLSLDLGPNMDNQWAPLIYTTGDHDAVHRAATASHNAGERHSSFLTFDQRESATRFCPAWQSARENARTVREMHQLADVGRAEQVLSDGARRRRRSRQRVLDSPFEFFEQIKQSAYMLEGVTEATMSHGEAWHFRRLGRLLERADKTSRILDVKYFMLLPERGRRRHAARHDSVGRAAAKRQRLGNVSPGARPHHARSDVAEFLILDRDFPRAMRFCLIRAEQSLLAITGGTHGHVSQSWPSSGWAGCARNSTIHIDRRHRSTAACTSSSTVFRITSTTSVGPCRPPSSQSSRSPSKRQSSTADGNWQYQSMA